MARDVSVSVEGKTFLHFGDVVGGHFLEALSWDKNPQRCVDFSSSSRSLIISSSNSYHTVIP